MPISVTAKGNYHRLDNYFQRLLSSVKLSKLDKYGQEGVEALRLATPKDTGKTSESWTYDITRKDGKITITWSNTNVNDGRIIALLLQYGHGTNSGTYVNGIDYINPAMKPVFDSISDRAWKEVIKA